MLRRPAITSGLLLAAVLGCAAWAAWLESRGGRLLVGAAPFFGHWQLRFSYGTPLAVLIGYVVVSRGSRVAASLAWRPLLAMGSLSALAWSVSLALVDGTRGLLQPLGRPGDYLADAARVAGDSSFLSHFVSHVSAHDSHPWGSDVAGHPPGMVLVFAGLRCIGLKGPGFAAALCVVVACSSVAAVLICVRAVVDEQTARAAAPYLVVLPAALWIAVSADAFFLGVSAWAVAFLAQRSRTSALAGGLLMGAALMLSYGLLVMGVLAAVVLIMRCDPLRILLAAFGVLVVIGAFAGGGFFWWHGLSATLIRYQAGAGGYRPYSYFLVANLVLFAVAVGPAGIAGLRGLTRRDPLTWLVAAMALGVLAADLSGNSKAEVERIWLPFVPWIVIGAGRLPGQRVWLGAQTVLAVALESCLVSRW